MENIKLLASKLQPLLSRKQSKVVYAHILNTSVENISEAMVYIRSNSSTIPATPKMDSLECFDQKISYTEDSIQIQGYYDHPPQPEEVIKDHKIDTKKWKLSACWSIQKGNGWRVSAQFTPLRFEEDKTKMFIDFLENYKPKANPTIKYKKDRFDANTCLILNKQDAHYNKLSIDGNNDINQRFSSVYNKIEKILKKATLSSNLEKVIYVLGSDIFNSEATNTTTHGTPQQNIGLYDESFEAVCGHEISVINLLLQYSKDIEIIYIPGNHDKTIGWHLVNWLKAYYRNVDALTINGSPSYSKYIKYSDSAIMFNHGYRVKPEQLAQNFPIEFKDKWSQCNHFYCFLGDKHTELSKDIGGIKFFRLAQISNAKSDWDAEMGYSLVKGALTAFLIEENNGITDTYREIL